MVATELSSDPRLLDEVVDALRDGVALFDASARLIHANEAFKLLNPKLADVVIPGMEWDNLLIEMVARGAVAPSTRERLQWMESRLEPGEDSIPPLTVKMRESGVHEFTMRQTSGGGFVLTQSDVTTRSQSDEDEREADALLRKVMEACPAALVMSRITDGQIIYRSPAARDLLGPGQNAGNHFVSRTERGDFVTALLPEGRIDELTIELRRTDESCFPALVSARLIEYRGDDVIVSSIVDITKEVALRKTLAQQRERIFQAEKLSALGELLAGVAHELNNPLSVVVGHALMMREETSDPQTIARIEKIGDAAERCARIVKSFLAMARQQKVDAKPSDLATIIAAARSTFMPENAPEIIIELPDDLPFVLAERSQLEQVFGNLMLNASQAMVTSSTGDRITLTARLLPGGESIGIDVVDNGPGIPAEIGKRVFEPLFTTKPAGQGTGIGLAFCHRVIHSHGGTIEIMPSDEGAHFHITMPVAGAMTRPADEMSAHGNGGEGHVLVIDDEEDVADLISEILKREGYQVDCAPSGEEGLELATTHDYDAILTDMNMPGISGRGFHEALGRRRPALLGRVAFVTGDTMSPDVRDFLDQVGCEFLEKPIAPKDLRELTRRVVAGVKGRG
jgi:signal transduction histidine kinase/ActR/RegA family two-component response regulator